MTIKEQIISALYEAHNEKGCPHNYKQHSMLVVNAILYDPGIEGFDEKSVEHIREALAAVREWRVANPNSAKEQ